MKKIFFILFAFLGLVKMSFGQIIISSNTTWSGPQFLSQKVIVSQGVTLTIEQSTVIDIGYVDSNGDNIGDVEIEVNGKIVIKGKSECSPVIFRPFTATSNRKYWKGIKINSNVANDSISGAEIYNAEMPFNILTNTTISDCKIRLFDNTGIYFSPSVSGVQLNVFSTSLKSGKTAFYQSGTTSNLNAEWVFVDSCVNGVIGNTGNINLKSSLVQNSSRLGVSFNNGNMTVLNSRIKFNYAFGIFNSSGNLTVNNCDIDTNYLGGILIAGVGNNSIMNSNIRYNKGAQIEIAEYGFNINSEAFYSSFGDGFPTINANFNNILGDTLSTVLDTLGLFDLPSSANGPCWASLGPLFSSCITYFTNSCQTNGTSGNTSPLIYKTALGRLAKFWVAYGASLSSNANTRCFGLNVRDEITNLNLGGTGACAGPGQQLQICISSPSQGGTFNVTPTYEQDKYLFVSSSGSSGGNFLVTAGSNISYYLFGGDLLFNNIRPSIFYTPPSFNFQNNNFAQPVLTNYFFDQTNQVFNYQGFTIFNINNSGVTTGGNLISSNQFPTVYLRTNTGYDTICSGNVFYLIAPEILNTSYNWYLNGNLFITTSNNQYTPPVSGIWHCVINNASCSITTTARNIFFGTNPIINVNGNQSICSGQSTTISLTGASSYSWSSGSTGGSQILSPTNTSSYTVTGYLSGCFANTSFNITVNSLPNVTITPYPSVILCQGNSTQLSTITGNNYQWSNGITTQTNNVTTAGVYSVTVTDLNGCSSSSPNTTVVVVSPPPIPTISASGLTTFCTGGSVNLTSSSLTGNLWSNGSTARTITVSTSGNFSVTVTDINGCSSSSITRSVTVISIPPIPTITSSGSTSLCSGESVVLTSSTAVNYLWSNGSTSQSTTVNSSGTYTVTVSNGYCNSSSLGTTVTVNPNPPVPTISASGPTTFCSGGSVVLTSSSSVGNLWSNGITTQSITVSTSGIYTVAVSNGTCTSNSSGTNITVNTSPPVPSVSTSGTTNLCSGGSVVLTSSSAVGNLWSNGITTQSITINTSGTYTVTVSNGNCTSSSIGTVVTVNVTPPIPTVSASGPTSFCSGDSVILTSSSAIGNLWSNGATTQSITVNVGGTYSVSVTNGNCIASSLGKVVVVNSPPTIPLVSSNGPTTFCSGNSVILTSSSLSGNLWSNGSTSQSISVNSSGIYSVTVSNGNCSSSSTGTIITVNSTPPIPIITTNRSTSLCTGDSVVLTSSSAIGNLWSNGSTTNSITVNNSGTYTVTVSNGNCNSISLGTTVTVNPNPPVPTISAGGPTTFCSGGSVVLTSSSSVGNLWSNGMTAQSISVNSSGVYTVTVSNGNCFSSSIGIIITINSTPPIPIITTNRSTSLCTGDSVVLTSSSAIGNLWSNGSTTNSITVNNSGTYTVTVSNGNCSASSVGILVTVNSYPPMPTISSSGSTTFCLGDSVVLTSSSPVGNLWSNGLTTQSISVLNNGNFNVSVSNGSCTSNSITFNIIALPLPNIVVNNSGPYCLGDSITLSCTSGFSYFWSGPNGFFSNLQNPIISNPIQTVSGIYSVTATNTAGCSATSSTSVFFNLINIILQPLDLSISAGNNAQFTVSSSNPNATYQWQTDLGFGFVNLNNAGQYNGATNDTLTVSNVTSTNNNQQFRCIISSGACTDTSDVALLSICAEINTQPQSQTLFNGTNAQFVSSVADPNASYQWQTDLGFGFVNLNNAGQYSGVTNDTLTVSNISSANNNQQFRCLIVSGSCLDTSVVAILTVQTNTSTVGTLIPEASVYPNPFESSFVLSVPHELLNRGYRIMDCYGKILLESTIGQQLNNIDLSLFAPGIYFLQIEADKVFKLIKY